MKFQNKSFKLKNNKEIIIRESRLEDAEGLINAAKSYIADSEHILLTVNEFNPTVEQEEKWIKSFKDNPDSLLLVAEYDNKIIGNIDLTANRRDKLNHTANIGISIIKDWRGIGVGNALLKSAIEWTSNNSNLLKLWLEVFATNESGIALYKKLGFREEGRQTNFIKIANNQFVDNIIMGLDIS